MPDIITANITRNVSVRRLNARWTYSAAPPASGYFVTSSA